MMNMGENSNEMQTGLLDDRMYTDPLDSVTTYLYSSQLLLAPNQEAISPKRNSGLNDIKSLLSNQCRQNKSGGKREIQGTDVSISGTYPPRKVVIKESVDTSLFQKGGFISDQPGDRVTQTIPLEHGSSFAEPANIKPYKTPFETMLSNAMNSSPANLTTHSISNTLHTPTQMDTNTEAVHSNIDSQVSNVDMKLLGDQPTGQKLAHTTAVVNQRGMEYSELPPQLQAPSLTAHLQAVMSGRTNLPSSRSAIPRNKSDTQLVSLTRLDKSFSTQYTRNPNVRRDNSLSVPTKMKRTGRIPKNMSDSNLVQMAKESPKVFARRRLASISVDSRPLILPKNFSDSNLCAMALGGPRRPKPILPKNLVAIAPSSGSVARVAVTIASSINPIMTQTTVAGGQFTTFLVNKQQPCSAEPVQVTLYMPKPKQSPSASSHVVTKTEASFSGGTASSLPQRVEALPQRVEALPQRVEALPQRVEVIQYQGSMLESNTKPGEHPSEAVVTASHVQPQVSVGRRSDFGDHPFHKLPSNAAMRTGNESISNGSVYSALTTSQSRASMADTSFQTAATNTVVMKPTNIYHEMSSATGTGISNSVPSIASLTERVSAACSLQTNALPGGASIAVLDASGITAASDRPTQHIAPLQGLSEQQLVSLAQILQGTSSGNTGQENTIAYLELLQQQLNVLLQQQQAMLKSKRDDSGSGQQPVLSLEQQQLQQHQQHVQQQRIEDVQQQQKNIAQQQQQPPDQLLHNQQQQQQHFQQQQYFQAQQQNDQQHNRQQQHDLGQQQQQHVIQQHDQQTHQQNYMQQQQQQQQQQSPAKQNLGMNQVLEKTLQSREDIVQHMKSQQLAGNEVRFISAIPLEQNKQNSALHQHLRSEQVLDGQPVQQQLSANQSPQYAQIIRQNSDDHLRTAHTKHQSLTELKFMPYEASTSSPAAATQRQQHTINQQAPRHTIVSTAASQQYFGVNSSNQTRSIQMQIAPQPHRVMVSSQCGGASQQPLLSTVDTSAISSIRPESKLLQYNSQASFQSAELSSHMQDLDVQIIRVTTPGALSSAQPQGVKVSSTTGGTVRPTMVDLAIAASQRSYLVDRSPSYSESTIETVPRSPYGLQVFTLLFYILERYFPRDRGSVYKHSSGQWRNGDTRDP